MPQKKRGPVKGTPEWDKKVMGNKRDEKRINNMSNSVFGADKSTEKIFTGGKSKFYPKSVFGVKVPKNPGAEKTSTTVKRVTNKAVASMRAGLSKRKK